MQNGHYLLGYTDLNTGGSEPTYGLFWSETTVDSQSVAVIPFNPIGWRKIHVKDVCCEFTMSTISNVLGISETTGNSGSVINYALDKVDVGTTSRDYTFDISLYAKTVYLFVFTKCKTNSREGRSKTMVLGDIYLSR